MIFSDIKKKIFFIFFLLSILLSSSSEEKMKTSDVLLFTNDYFDNSGEIDFWYYCTADNKSSSLRMIPEDVSYCISENGLAVAFKQQENIHVLTASDNWFFSYDGSNGDLLNFSITDNGDLYILTGKFNDFVNIYLYKKGSTLKFVSSEKQIEMYGFIVCGDGSSIYYYETGGSYYKYDLANKESSSILEYGDGLTLWSIRNNTLACSSWDDAYCFEIRENHIENEIKVSGDYSFIFFSDNNKIITYVTNYEFGDLYISLPDFTQPVGIKVSDEVDTVPMGWISEQLFYKLIDEIDVLF